jgi:hypothetical protein
MKKEVCMAMALLTLVAWRTAGADPEGERVIALMDQALTSTDDQSFVYEVTTQEPGKEPSVMEFEVTIKGEMRRLEFLAPGDVKGMRFLVRSISQLYVYMPSYRRVRRVASHVRGQGFMGTAYHYDDMSVVTYGPSFSCDLTGETDTHWSVKCKRKPGADIRYAGLEIDILKTNHQPSGFRYFNEKGVKLKTETREDFKCIGKACRPRLMKTVDHTRGDMWSQMLNKDWKINTKVKDSFFTVRSLQRGR